MEFEDGGTMVESESSDGLRVWLSDRTEGCQGSEHNVMVVVLVVVMVVQMCAG
jgi:hypothetical protein